MLHFSEKINYLCDAFHSNWTPESRRAIVITYKQPPFLVAGFHFSTTKTLQNHGKPRKSTRNRAETA